MVDPENGHNYDMSAMIAVCLCLEQDITMSIAENLNSIKIIPSVISVLSLKQETHIFAGFC